MDMWKRSPSPEETWSDAEGGNDNGEWPVKGIVGEEIDPDGTSMYEVRWGNWSRHNGTNTTWQTDIPDRADLVNRWKRKQRSKRNAIAQESLDIEVAWPDDDVHNRFTFLRVQAYEEKKLKRPGIPSAADWDQEIESARRCTDEPDAEDGNAASRLRVRRCNSRSTISSDSPRPGSVKRTRRGGTPLNRRSSSSGRDVTEGFKKIATSIPAKSEQASISAWSLTSSSSDVKGDLPFVRSTKPLHGRTLLLNNWNRAAKEASAAAIHISSTITDAEIGQHLEKFTYMERKYYFDDPDLQSIFEVDKGAFLACTCKRCDRASQCECQAESELKNGRGHKAFAYSEGLLAFSALQGVEVIECNKSCRCGPSCGNRVAQAPRNIPIEIFQTGRCGWGARCAVRLSRGKVLGVYTGRLLRREDVDDLPVEHVGYVFDLDGTEIHGQQTPGAKFSVDSYDHGNWTRFVNHSCAPNMKVYSVVFDTIQEVNMPYVAFAAVRDIPAGEELTIDYHPSAAEEMAAGTRDAKQKMLSTGILCKCGARQCRGWIKQ